MSLLVKIQNGTRPSGGQDLCRSCSNSMIIRGDSESEEIRRCDNISKVIPFRKVVECNGYHNKTLTPLSEMKQMAWILETDSKRTKIGFKPAHEWMKDNNDKHGHYIIPDDN